MNTIQPFAPPFQMYGFINHPGHPEPRIYNLTGHHPQLVASEGRGAYNLVVNGQRNFKNKTDIAYMISTAIQYNWQKANPSSRKPI